MKLNIFIIIFVTSSNKYVKYVVLINHSWISPTLQSGWGLEFGLFSKKDGGMAGGGGIFFAKKGEVGKIVDGC